MLELDLTNPWPLFVVQPLGLWCASDTRIVLTNLTYLAYCRAKDKIRTSIYLIPIIQDRILCSDVTTAIIGLVIGSRSSSSIWKLWWFDKKNFDVTIIITTVAPQWWGCCSILNPTIIEGWIFHSWTAQVMFGVSPFSRNHQMTIITMTKMMMSIASI